MIALAIRNRDIETVEKLHGRETSDMTSIDQFAFNNYKFEEKKDEELIKTVAQADEDILELFSSEFDVDDNFGNPHTFIYPFLGEVIDLMLKNGDRKVELPLRKAIRHNKEVYRNLTDRISEITKAYKEQYSFMETEELDSLIKKELEFYMASSPDGKILRVLNPFRRDTESSYVSNYITITRDSNSPILKELIAELKETAEKLSQLAEGGRHAAKK